MADYDQTVYSPVERWDSLDEVYYRLTWRDYAKQLEEQVRELDRWRRLCSDLDRCEHGRHEGDVCASCGGPSHGNRLIGHAPIGHTMDTAHIFVPERAARNEAGSWIVAGPCRDPHQAGTSCPIGAAPNRPA